MSAHIANARQGLRQVPSNIKQGKSQPSVQAVQNALNVMRGSLMKSERKEFVDLLITAVECLKGDALVRQIFPTALEYTPGNEAQLAQTMQELQVCFAEHAQQEAIEAQRLLEEKKRATFERGKEELTSSNPQKGINTFNVLKREHPQDVELMGNMGQALLEAKLYEEAVEFLSEALDLREDSLPLYNSIGIALRHLRRFSSAEVYYLRASKYLRNDPNLYFNISRLYLEWQKYPKATQAVNVALKLDPDFEQAKKLQRYIEKQQALKDQG